MHDDPALRDEPRRKAVAAARRKADVYARTAGAAARRGVSRPAWWRCPRAWCRLLAQPLTPAATRRRAVLRPAR
ncbi:MAG: hypothetical protein ACJ736_19140 [Streptomyces sp.]